MEQDFKTTPALERFVLDGVINGLQASREACNTIRLMSPVNNRAIGVSPSKDPENYALLVEYEYSQFYVSGWGFEFHDDNLVIFLMDMGDRCIGNIQIRIY